MENPPQDLPYQITLLDPGNYTRPSHLVRVGDAVCSLMDRTAMIARFVFRFGKRCQLDVDENRIIQQDFEERGAFVEFVKFTNQNWIILYGSIGTCPGVWKRNWL